MIYLNFERNLYVLDFNYYCILYIDKMAHGGKINARTKYLGR